MITIVVVLFCFVAVAIRRMEGSWYSPAALFSLLWSLIILFSILSAPDYYFSVPALLFILLNLIIFFTGGKIFEYYANFKTPDSLPSVSYPDYGNIRCIYVIPGIVSGWLALILLIYNSGGDLYLFFDKSKLMDFSSRLTVERYEGVRLSSLTMLFLTVSYLSSFFAGMDLAIKPGRSSRIRFVLLLLPVLAFTLIYTARAVLLFMIFIIIASYVVFRPYNRLSKPKLFSKFNIILVFTGMLLIFLVFFIAQAARMQVENFGIHQVEMLLDHLKVWFSGNISAFSIWYDSGIIHAFGNQGTNTLAGLYELLGISTRKLGIYNLAADVNNQMEFSNIYTLFRFLLDDFGTIGCGILIFIFGGFSRKLYSDGIKNHNLVSGALLSGIIVMLLWSFITSAFAYNSVLFAWIGFVIVVKFNLRYAG